MFSAASWWSFIFLKTLTMWLCWSEQMTFNILSNIDCIQQSLYRGCSAAGTFLWMDKCWCGVERAGCPVWQSVDSGPTGPWLIWWGLNLSFYSHCISIPPPWSILVCRPAGIWALILFSRVADFPLFLDPQGTVDWHSVMNISNLPSCLKVYSWFNYLS